MNEYESSGVLAGIGAGAVILYLAIVVIMIVGMWKVFEKAGKPGWAAIVPFYNTIVLLRIVGRPAWWFLLFLVPLVNVVVSIVVYFELAKVFGKGAGYAVLLFLLPVIGFPMLAFGDSKYNAAAARH